MPYESAADVGDHHGSISRHSVLGEFKLQPFLLTCGFLHSVTIDHGSNHGFNRTYIFKAAKLNVTRVAQWVAK